MFPKIDIPDFVKDSKSAKWDPSLYQPMVYNEKIKYLSETLKPGTLEYDDFWDEMDYYCYNGFKPKGMPRITGRHFYYLNFNFIDLLHPGEKIKRLGSPLYRDLDHWLFLELESALEHGYGIVLTKPRRIGLSEWGALNSNYNLTFFSRNKIGICAGKEDKALEFYEKLRSSLENVHPAYRSGRIITNDSKLQLGYKDRINKQNVDCGLNTLARIKTMFADSKAFEGGSYSIVIFEEAGLFENLTTSYKATEPCFKDGHLQFGIPLIYGTGGDMDKGAKGFKKMWDEHEAYNVKPIFVPANFYYPGDGVPDEKTGKTVSFFNRKTGVTDRKLAKKYIELDRKRASKSKDTYTQHIQQYPLRPEEVFLKSKGGLLDTIKLNFQVKKIHAGEEPEPVVQGNLIWKDTPETTALLQRANNLKEKTKIRVSRGSKVEFQINENGVMFKDSSPINQNITHLDYKPDIGGCDSYDDEVDLDNPTISAGAIMAYRCFSGPSREHNKPVGVLVQRGDGSFDDDEFYENAVKFAIYWDMEVLIEHTKYHLTRYFYDVGAGDHVRFKPVIEEAGTDSHKNKDGIKMTTTVKNVGTKLLKSEVKNEIHKCFFLNVILDLMNYGDTNTDIAMAYMMCLFHRMDLFEEITENIEVGSHEEQESLGGEYYYVDFDGDLKIGNSDNSGKTKMQTFIPERDLNPYEYDQYLEQKRAPINEIKREQEAYEKEAIELGVDPSLLNLILKERENFGK